jgi:hypothetical protein
MTRLNCGTDIAWLRKRTVATRSLGGRVCQEELVPFSY